MSSRRSMAFVMDPIEAISIREDTTFVLMLAAQERGHEVLYVDPADLCILEGGAAALAVPVTLRRREGDHVEKGTARWVVFDKDVDVAFQRVDPPVDNAYTIATQILGTCARTLVLNRPSGILAHNEKLFALHFADLMAETLVARRSAQLLEFMTKMGGEMILKPLDGKGGEGIFHVHKDDRNLFSILEQSTNFGARAVMAQRYLPAIREGDKRILLLEGDFLGALLRVPAADEVRANLHVGGSAVRTAMDDADRVIVERLGPILRREGLFFVGVDVIGGKLTEINVTSPTGVQEVNTLQDTRLELQVIERVEARLDERG